MLESEEQAADTGERILTHGTCVCVGDAGILLRGKSGSGKSDLALRFLHLPLETTGVPARLVADDQVYLQFKAGRIHASCPPALAGLFEVRGLGIMRMTASRDPVTLRLICDLVPPASVPRMPQDDTETVFSASIRRIRLDPFEASAAIKLALSLRLATEDCAERPFGKLQQQHNS